MSRDLAVVIISFFYILDFRSHILFSVLGLPEFLNIYLLY